MIALRRPPNERLDSLLKREAKAELTYEEHGATRHGPDAMPQGYAHDYLTAPAGRGRAAFEAASEHVMTWEMHRGAGFEIVAPQARIEENQTALVIIRIAGVRFVASARITYTIAEENRCGFAYGTLPAHPEIGEEWFGVTIDEDEVVHFEVWAFSQPGLTLAKLGRPVTRAIQKRTAHKYLASVARSVDG